MRDKLGEGGLEELTHTGSKKPLADLDRYCSGVQQHATAANTEFIGNNYFFCNNTWEGINHHI